MKYCLMVFMTCCQFFTLSLDHAPSNLLIQLYEQIRGGVMEGLKVVIRTDSNEYVGGDTIYGSLYLCVPSGCTATSLKLVIRGHELCEYDYQYIVQQDSLQAKLGQRKARKDLLRVEQKLVDYPDGFPEGYFAYPFRYQLPHGLPGVFNSKYEDTQSGRVWQGVIKYMLGALIENSTIRSEHKLMGETSFSVLDSIECSRGNPNQKVESFSAMGSVKTFFCINRGNIKVSSSLDRQVYEPQDKVTVNLNVENGSAVDVSGATMKVIRVIKLYGLDKAREEEEYSAHTVYDTVIEVVHSGCFKNSNKKSHVDLELKELCALGLGLPFTTSGSLIKCSYVIDIDVHVPWAPDIEVRLPLIIKPVEDKDWKVWQPPEWVMKCTQEQVAGICAVPQDVLESQSFSGMPSFQPVL